MVPGLHVWDATPEEDDAALRELARWAIGYSPVVAPDPPDGVWIDIAGCAHLFGSEEALLAHLLGRLDNQGVTARAAVADAPGAAWAVARFRGGGVFRSVDPSRPWPRSPWPRCGSRPSRSASCNVSEWSGSDSSLPCRAPMVRRFGKDVARN
jgi:protein ImuB